MGTTVRQVVYDIGGIPNGKNLKLFKPVDHQRYTTEKDLDTPIDYDNLIQKDQWWVLVEMIVMDEDNRMVDVAKFYMEFIVDESCGKCTSAVKEQEDYMNF